MRPALLRRLLLIGLFNLCLVALWGMLMRYKIAFNFPALDQKHAQHAHSHFAFAGWVTHMLYTLYTYYLCKYKPDVHLKKYISLIVVNLLAAIGMLFSFTAGGYSALSIIFSTITIVVGVFGAVFFIRDSRHVEPLAQSRPWLVTGLLAHVFSAIGPFMLAYMMATHTLQEKIYLGSVYFLLHFEYNGWFFFGCMGLFLLMMQQTNLNIRREFMLLAICLVPTYFLSTLWAKLPLWLLIITAIAACVQLIAWIMLAAKLWKQRAGLGSEMKPVLKFLLFLAGACLTLKYILQAISTQPDISRLVFGFRPIVIAYLHLVLLAVISLFLLTYVFARKLIVDSKTAIAGLVFFTIAIFLNQIILAIQGIASFAYFPVPFANEGLFVVAVMLFTGALWMLMSQRPSSANYKLPDASHL